MEIKPIYTLANNNGIYGISGTENSTGETVDIPNLTRDRATAFELLSILESNSVSVHHAKDVIRDKLLEALA